MPSGGVDQTRWEHRDHADAALVVDLEQVVAAGVGHHPRVPTDQQPVGVAVDPGLAAAGASALVGVVGGLEAGEVGHRADPAQVDLEQVAEATGARAERRALGGAAEVAEQQVAGPAGEPEVDRAGGGDAALVGE